jgi:hypothetical protein
VRRAAVLLMAAALAEPIAACTAGPLSVSHVTSAPAAHAKSQSLLAREGLLIPSTYQQACASEGSICLTTTGGRIPAVLGRPLHFPVLRPGQRCPASPGERVNNFNFRGIALGSAPVRVLIAGIGALRRGEADLINPTSSPPWQGLKTLWFSVPAYQGPFVIRAKRLGHPGPVALGEAPTVAPLVVPPGPTLNGTGGWREAPGGLWVRTPGCYAWQVDGLTFSEVIVVRAVR